MTPRTSARNYWTNLEAAYLTMIAVHHELEQAGGLHRSRNGENQAHGGNGRRNGWGMVQYIQRSVY